MTNITGTEPRHWHNAGGQHRMPDLRKITYPAHFWDADERAYIAHLEEHEAGRSNPRPEAGDSDQIKTLFEIIRTSETAARNARLLITALRTAGLGTVDQVKEQDHAGHIPDA